MSKRRYAIVIGLGLLSALPAGSASAQGLFDFFFGHAPRRMAPPRDAAPGYFYADPNEQRGDEEDAPRRSTSGGTYATYCVRLCDGSYFPLPRTGNASAAELCNSFCPAAPTKIYSGSGIDNAVASDGTRYDSLDNAYAYRDKVAANCTCNGKDAFGVARLNIKDDPTLRKGDIVATSQGLMAYAGGKNNNMAFTPISGDAQRRLASVKVRTAPSAETTGAASTNEKKDDVTQGVAPQESSQESSQETPRGSSRDRRRR